MRHFGAAFMGVWYSLVLASSLVVGVKSLSNEISGGPGSHYVILGIAWLAAVGFAAFLAGETSRTYPLALCFSAALPVLALYFFYWEEGAGSYRLPAPVFGWGPTVATYTRGLLLLGIGASFVGGLAAQSELQRGRAEENQILEVPRGHWLWLWIPISSWAGAIPGALFLLWLTVAAEWHWIFHPSLWFNWRWWLFLQVGGIIFTGLPYILLSTGLSEAWDILSSGRQRGISKTAIAFRFIAWGYGCAVVGCWLSMFIGFWIFSHLPY
jgi:hypothetical protein